MRPPVRTLLALRQFVQHPVEFGTQLTQFVRARAADPCGAFTERRAARHLRDRQSRARVQPAFKNDVDRQRGEQQSLTNTAATTSGTTASPLCDVSPDRGIVHTQQQRGERVRSAGHRGQPAISRASRWSNDLPQSCHIAGSPH